MTCAQHLSKILPSAYHQWWTSWSRLDVRSAYVRFTGGSPFGEEFVGSGNYFLRWEFYWEGCLDGNFTFSRGNFPHAVRNICVKTIILRWLCWCDGYINVPAIMRWFLVKLFLMRWFLKCCSLMGWLLMHRLLMDWLLLCWIFMC